MVPVSVDMTAHWYVDRLRSQIQKMKVTEKFDNFIAGFVSGILLPVLVGLIIYLFSPGNLSIQGYIFRIVETHIYSFNIDLRIQQYHNISCLQSF